MKEEKPKKEEVIKESWDASDDDVKDNWDDPSDDEQTTPTADGKCSCSFLWTQVASDIPFCVIADNILYYDIFISHF